jgi:hypothetical protein
MTAPYRRDNGNPASSLISAPACYKASLRARRSRREIRRSVLEQSLRYGPFEARRTASSVALLIFWRMRGEVQRSETIAPGRDRYESGLRERPTNFERASVPSSWRRCGADCTAWPTEVPVGSR